MPSGTGCVYLHLGYVVHARNSPKRPVLIRSEEHTSELQSLAYLVCRLLLEKKKKIRCKYVLSLTWRYVSSLGQQGPLTLQKPHKLRPYCGLITVAHRRLRRRTLSDVRQGTT